MKQPSEYAKTLAVVEDAVIIGEITGAIMHPENYDMEDCRIIVAEAEKRPSISSAFVDRLRGRCVLRRFAIYLDYSRPEYAGSIMAENFEDAIVRWENEHPTHRNVSAEAA